MADENKIQLEVELSQGSIDKSFSAVDERAEKSAKASAAVFGEYFQKQEDELKASIERLVGSTKKVAEKSAKESAEVFQDAFRKQDEIYKASVKQNLQNAIKALTGEDAVKKSAAQSAAVFEEAFGKTISKADPVALPVQVPNSPLAIRGLADLAGGFFLLKQAADIAKTAIGSAFDVVLQGEERIKLEGRFQVLATQVGIAADVLKKELEPAVSGLVGSSELLNLASASFVQLGENAKSLPRILELARKTYDVFGGDIVANTNAINNAIFSGQTRQLRQLGILVDTQKVYKDYARSIGTVVPLLSEQQKQTALLNEVLRQGEDRFKNISNQTSGAKDAFTQARTALGELNAELAKAASRNFSGIFSGVAEAVTGGLNSIRDGLRRARPAETVDEIVTKMQALRDKVAEYNRQLTDLGAASSTALGASLRAGIITAEQQLSEYSDRLDKMQMKQASALAAAGPTPQESGVSEEFLRRRQELVARVQALNDQLNQSELQLAQQEFQRLQTRANLEKLTYEQRKAEGQKFIQESAALEKFYADNGIADETLRQQGREALQSAHVNRLLQIDRQYQEQRKMIFDGANTQILSVGEAFVLTAQGMEIAAQELSVNAAASFKNMGKAMLTNIGQAAGQAFAAFGAAVRNGENALEAFGKSLLNSLGQAAIQMGTTFILQGIAYTYAGLANGPPLIAAGAALAAAGGLLAASTGVGPSDGGGSAGFATGFEGGNPLTEAPKPEDTLPETPQTAINLTINGNVLDRRETGLEIAQILEEQFADQGLVVRGA